MATRSSRSRLDHLVNIGWSGKLVLPIILICALYQGNNMQAFSAPTGAGPGSILPPGNWTLVVNDEFTGARLDTNMWETIPDATIRNGSDYIVNSRALSFGAGLLTISGFDASGLPGNWKNSSGGGEIQSRARYGNGYYEARVKAGPSGWGVFWVIGDNYDCRGDATHGFEADILESIGGGAQNNVHWGGYRNCHRQSPTPVATGIDDFHVWGMLYDADKGLIFYRDGVQTKHFPGPAGTTRMFIKLTNASVHNTADSRQSQLVIDWVRYYRRK